MITPAEFVSIRAFIHFRARPRADSACARRSPLGFASSALGSRHRVTHPRARDMRVDAAHTARPRRVHFLVDARATRERASATQSASTSGADFKSSTWKTFARRALERAVDGRAGEDVEFTVRACDGSVPPHAFDARAREATGRRGDEFGKFRRCDKNAVEDAFRTCETTCGEYLETFTSGGDVAASDEDGRGAIESWLVNATRNVGAATNDFAAAGGGFAATFADDDDEGEKYSALFIITALPEMSEAEAAKVDAKHVAKLFKGIEEKFKRDRVRAHLLYVGDGPTGAFADVLQETFHKLNGAVISLDVASRLASWLPLYSTLSALSRGDEASASTTTVESTSTVDIIVETRDSQSAHRLGEAHQARYHGRGDGSIAIVGFIDRAEAPSAAALAVETQTILCFDDSPIRALMAMLVLKDAVAVVRRDAGRHEQIAILEPLTCSSFIVTSLKTTPGELCPRASAAKASARSEIVKLASRRDCLASLENVHVLLAKIREDVREKIVSPPATQDSLALTQQVLSMDAATQSSSAPLMPVDVNTLEEAFIADQRIGVQQDASRLEAWYGSRDLVPKTREMLRRVEDKATKSSDTAGELLNDLDERFKDMLKRHNGIVSPPRKSRARRSLASTLTVFAMDADVPPWTGDVEQAALEEYESFVATFSALEGGDGLNEPNLHDFAAKIIYRFRLSVGSNEDDNLVERLERAIAKNSKELKAKYVGVHSSKTAKRLEFILQMHVALQLASLKVTQVRDENGADACEAVEERAISKKEQKKLVKSVQKLVDEIHFLLQPCGVEGVRSLMAAELTPHYSGFIPDTLRVLQRDLGLTMEPDAGGDASAVALTPFSPVPALRRSPRKPKAPERLAPAEPAPKLKIKAKPHEGWHHLARGRNNTKEVKVSVKDLKKPTFAHPRPQTFRGVTRHSALQGGATPAPSGNRALSTPAIVKCTPMGGTTPAPMRGGPRAIVAATPVGGAMSTPLANRAPVRKLADDFTPAKRSRLHNT